MKTKHEEKIEALEQRIKEMKAVIDRNNTALKFHNKILIKIIKQEVENARIAIGSEQPQH